MGGPTVTSGGSAPPTAALAAPPWTELLRAAIAGEPAAAQSLYLDLHRPVHAYVRAQGAGEADDLTSEIFLRVFRNLHLFSGNALAFRSWVFTIAHRTVVDARRQASRRPLVVDLRDGARVPGGDVEAEAMAGLGDARRVLESLTADQRDVLLLRVVADLSVEDTAAALGKRAGAVKTLQRRALAAAQRALTAHPDPYRAPSPQTKHA